MTTFLGEAFPVAVFANPGAAISLRQILDQALGSEYSEYQHFWIAYQGADFAQAANYSYWKPANPSVARWTVNGQDIGPDFVNQTYISAAQLDSVQIVAGNNIFPNLFLTVQLTDGASDPVYMEYDISVVAAQFQPQTAKGRAPTQAELVAMANAFASTYAGVPNPNDCHWINIATGAAAGATLRQYSWSLNPEDNFDGGFWRVVHRGSDNPTANWLSLTQPGDIVRFDWANPNDAQHTTMVVGTVGANGRVNVVDNVGGAIGLHNEDYDNVSVASSVTIYRLTDDNRYMTETTDQAETYAGTLFNDDIRAKGGDDRIRSGLGDDRVTPGPGDDAFDGGAGVDTAVFAGARSNYDIRTSRVGGVLETRIVHNAGADGGDRLTNVETLAFADADFTFAGAQLNRMSNVSATRFDDVLIQNEITGQVYVARMAGGAFQSWGLATGLLGADWIAVASGNVNPGAPGGAEVFVQNVINGTIYYASLDAGATNWGVVSSALTGDWKLRAVADVNGDASVDAIVQNAINGAIVFADMRDGVFRNWAAVNGSLTAEWIAVGAGDLNRDGYADVVVQNQAAGTTVYANMANGAFSGWGSVSNSLTNAWDAKAVADVTGDGFADVIFQHEGDGTTYYADMQGGALHHWGVVTNSITGDWLVEGAADVDNDGRADVLFQHQATGTTLFAEVNGSGPHAPAWGMVTASVTADWQVV